MKVNVKRKIIHVDMDAFYASVEQRDFPELRGKEIAVGGSPDGRGVVATASYEARKFGVRSAMSSRQALQLCPQIIFVRPRFDVYRHVSQHIREIFKRYTDLIEPLSLDEAYLDVTQDKMGVGSAIDIAKEIQQAIRTELDLTCSAGVSVNKFVAKIASDMNKPNGITFIGPSKVIRFLEDLPIEKFFGVGRVTAERMKAIGIHVGKDLKRLSENELQARFGKSGIHFFKMVRGEDDRPVRPDRISKSIGVEDTFETDIYLYEDIRSELSVLAEKLSKRLAAKQKEGRTLTLKIKFSDFRQITRSKTVIDLQCTAQSLVKQALSILDKVDIGEQKIRLLGLTVSNFRDELPKEENGQLRIFD